MSKQKIERVGIWIRVSTSMQVEGDSPEHHLHRARSYAEQQGWTVVEVYRLDGVSGRTVHEHSEMDRMRSDVESGKIQGLIFSSLNRLARKKSTLWDLAELFQTHNAALICLDMAIDTSTPAGELVFSIFGALAEWEAQLIGERVKASVKTRAKMGKSLGGYAVYGYQWVDGKLAPNHDEVPVRLLIYQLYLECQNYSMVARTLNERGYTTRNGKQWNSVHVSNLLRDTTAKGKHIKNHKRSRSLRKKLGRKKPESEWIVTDVEPIIDDETWESCNKIAKVRNSGHKGESTLDVFSGLVMCSKCFIKMYPDSKHALVNRKYRCKKCRAKFPCDILEKAMKNSAFEFFDTGSSGFTGKIESDITAGNELLKKQSFALSKIKKSIERADDDYISGTLSAQRYESLLKKLEAQQELIEKEISNLTGLIDALKTERQSSSQIAAKIHGELIRWDSFNYKEKKAFARALIERLEYKDGEIIIEICTDSHLIREI